MEQTCALHLISLQLFFERKELVEALLNVGNLIKPGQ
jgi:hypothetical protein